MNNENKILNKIIELTDLIGLGVAILVTKLAKEFMIITEKVYSSTLQNIYQLVYSQIPANATNIQSTVNVTYLNLLSNLQQITNNMITTLTIIEYLLYFLGFFILLLYIVVKKNIH